MKSLMASNKVKRRRPGKHTSRGHHKYDGPEDSEDPAYWVMHLELQNTKQHNHALAQENTFLKAQLEEAMESRNAVQQTFKAELSRQTRDHEAEIEAAKSQNTMLSSTLEQERDNHKKTLENALKVRAAMEKKYASLAEALEQQQQRAEETQKSGEKLHALAQVALEQAANQAQNAESKLESMRESLVLAQGYQLHTVLMRVQAQAEARERKLTRMVSHLQAEKIALRRNLVEVSQERDKLFFDAQRAQKISTPLKESATAVQTSLDGDVMDSGSSSSSYFSGSSSLIALAKTDLEQHGSGLEEVDKKLMKSLEISESYRNAIQAKLSQTLMGDSYLSRGDSSAPSQPRGVLLEGSHSKQVKATTNTTNATAVPSSEKKSSVRSRTRSALLAGLRSGKLEAAVSGMNDVNATSAAGSLAAVNTKNATAVPESQKPSSLRSRTRGALLAGLRSGKLEAAVNAMNADGSPGSSSRKVKNQHTLVPMRSKDGDVMAVQLKNAAPSDSRIHEHPVPIKTHDGNIMAMHIQKSGGHFQLHESKFSDGAKVEPVEGLDGDVLAVRVTNPEKSGDKSNSPYHESVRDSNGRVMAVRIS